MEHSVCADEVDRLSILPDHLLLEILYFLPTKFAARTSVLSRRFHNLWISSPSLDIDRYALRNTDLANRALLNRKPHSPLRRLCLHLYQVKRYDPKLPLYVESLISKASILGLRHLTVELEDEVLLPLLPFIFSLNSLESLSVGNLFIHQPSLSYPITLTHLKNLHLKMANVKSNMLTQILEATTMLEDLNLQVSSFSEINLRSVTVRRLKIRLHFSEYLRISVPSLEILELDIHGGPFCDQYSDLMVFRNCSRWEVPALKKAVIWLKYVSAKNVPDIYVMLGHIQHVEKLYLDIRSLDQNGPFDTLGGVNPPTYVNLKHIDLKICCHKLNVAALVVLLQRCPNLESLNMVHKPAKRSRGSKGGNLWRSELPRNAEGNYRHGYFKDLHIYENKKQLLKLLTRKLS